MPHLPEILRAFSRLLSYPDERMLEPAEFVYVALQSELPDAARDISGFGRFAEQCAPGDLEEAYTTTFDINPACALEVGWHLFGEEYARGQFLVRMREELRKYGIGESTELPDHLSHVLAVVAAMPDEEASRFVRACVLPALKKMQAALDATDSPYAGVLRSLVQVFEHRWQDSLETAEDGKRRAHADRSATGGVDLLHAFPVADAPFFDPVTETACHRGVELVPLQVNFHADVNGSTLHHPQPDNKHA